MSRARHLAGNRSTRYSYSTIAAILAQNPLRSGHDRGSACRAANFVAALERHLEAAASRSGEDDPTVIAAYEDVADAFEAYDEALLTPTAR